MRNEPLTIRLIELSDIYMTLKVSDVAKKPEDEPNVEALLFKMISDGIIKAKFDKK